MSYVPPFMKHLGLEDNADERAVRRAYAQQLKTTDPEVDPAGFQALHESFEAAKRWTRHRANLAEAEVAEAQQQAGHDHAPEQIRLDATTPNENRGRALEQEHLPPDAAAHGAHLTLDQVIVDEEADCAAVFAVFSGRFAEQSNQAKVDDLGAVRKELQQALDDPRLINLQARTSFERSIGQLLAGGWRPGHHVLFEVAVELFHWMDDRRRLDGLGGVGTFLNRVVLEYAVFLKSPDAQSNYRKGLIVRMRDSTPPAWRELDSNIKTLEAMFARYPNWFRVVTDLQNIAMWREKERMSLNLGEISVTPGSVKPKQTGLGVMPLGIVIAIAIIIMISHIFGGTHTPDYSQEHGQNQERVPVMNYGAPDQPIPYAWAKTPVIENIHYSKTQMQRAFDQINANVRYEVPTDRVANIPANFSVELAPDGTVNRVEKTASSARLEYDEAIRKAILKGQPYPIVAGQNGPALFRLSAYPYKN